MSFAQITFSYGSGSQFAKQRDMKAIADFHNEASLAVMHCITSINVYLLYSVFIGGQVWALKVFFFHLEIC